VSDQVSQGTSEGSSVVPRAAAAVAVRSLGDFAAGLRLATLPPAVRDALDLVLIDTLGVTLAGSRTPEYLALLSASGGVGNVRPRGTERRLSVEAAAFLDGTAACVLELDEGNKHARGHPAAHAVPAALAVAVEVDASAADLLEAIVVGHEVAARFGRATRLLPGFHPHGNWGVAGAAGAAARLLGCDAAGIAGAMDAAAGLALATPFDAALEGSYVRNTWTGMAAVSGIHAARLARAGLATVDGTAAATLGGLIGTFDPDVLVEELGTRFDLPLGYLKLHASCSFTHPPIDAVIALRTAHGIDAARVVDIEVRTHRLAVGLARTVPPTRLAAMFSIPHLVAVALRDGRVDVAASDPAVRSEPAVLALAERVRVIHDVSLDARAPAERPAIVRITLDDGTVLHEEVPNPIGDADHRPLDRTAVRSKLEGLIGAEDTARIERAVSSLREHPDRSAADLLDELP
jgi:2-methylcitrate dehydratase PrpD